MPFEIRHTIPNDIKVTKNVDDLVREFVSTFQPLEQDQEISLMIDPRTTAWFCECHVKGKQIVHASTVDVPLDPEEQPDYRANREMITSHSAFQTMVEDAKKRRSFSNIVAEFTTEFDPEHPLKIIGGQHRFEAIKRAGDEGVDELHGLKVYFGLDSEQRLDVQLISNTVIAVSSDLYDRMFETVKGPELRSWCQEVGLLGQNEDFADRRERGSAITVKAARTFITNYYLGVQFTKSTFDDSDTTPVVCKSGEEDPDWYALRERKPPIWKEPKLKEAGKEFSALINAQRAAFEKTKGNADFAEKALNFAVLSAWAFVAGILQNNEKRLQRHFSLAKTKGSKDPLNASALAKGRHKTDAENYRGLGYRTDAKERGRFVELFYLQAEKGEGVITPKLIELAIKKYHAKQAVLDVKRTEKSEKAVA